MSNDEDIKKDLDELDEWIVKVLKEAREENKEFELKLTEMETGSGAIPITWCLTDKWVDTHEISKYYVLRDFGVPGN